MLKKKEDELSEVKEERDKQTEELGEVKTQLEVNSIVSYEILL